MNKEEFKVLVQSTIDVSINEIVAKKTTENKALNYMDSKIISLKVRNLFSKYLTVVPNEIETVCLLTESFLSPSIKEKAELLKKAIGVGGGMAGLAAILAGIGAGLGWGAGVISAVITFFTGVAIAGPIGLIVGGIGISVIAGYFALSNDEFKNDESYRKALKESLNKAIDGIWEKDKNKLSQVDIQADIRVA